MSTAFEEHFVLGAALRALRGDKRTGPKEGALCLRSATLEERPGGLEEIKEQGQKRERYA